MAHAYLMVLIDTRWPEPKVVDARVMSDDNPTCRSGCRWARLAGEETDGRDFQEAHERMEDCLRPKNSPHLDWVRKLMSASQRPQSLNPTFEGQPCRRTRIVGR